MRKRKKRSTSKQLKLDTHLSIAEQHQSVREKEKKHGYVLISEQNGKSIEGNAFKMLCVYVTIKFIYNLF